MDDKAVRLEVLRIAAAHCGTNNSLDVVKHADVFERYVKGPLEPTLETPRKAGRPPKKKAK